MKKEKNSYMVIVSNGQYIVSRWYAPDKRWVGIEAFESRSEAHEYKRLLDSANNA